MGVIIYGCNGMYFIALLEQCSHKAHPEIVDIPGSIQDDSDSHLGSGYEKHSNPYFRQTVEISDDDVESRVRFFKVKKK
jgi:hypothetical protein